MDYSDVEKLIDSCLDEIDKASKGDYDSEQAERSAALLLKTQIKLAYLIEEIELRSKNSKNEINRIEGDKYFEFKTANADKKTTDAMITAAVSKDPEVVQAKKDFAADEAAYKKWNYLSASLKEGHIFFRGMGRKI